MGIPAIRVPRNYELRPPEAGASLRIACARPRNLKGPPRTGWTLHNPRSRTCELVRHTVHDASHYFKLVYRVDQQLLCRQGSRKLGNSWGRMQLYHDTSCSWYHDTSAMHCSALQMHIHMYTVPRPVHRCIARLQAEAREPDRCGGYSY